MSNSTDSHQAQNQEPKPTRDNNFSTTLLGNLKSQQMSRQLTDFTIWVKDAAIQAHKNILATACPYFKALIESDMSEAQAQETHLDDIELEMVQKVVDYFYSGIIKIEADSLKDLAVIADYLQLDELKMKCTQFIKEDIKICPENCLSWLQFSSRYNLEEVASRSKELIQMNFIDMSEGEEFLQLSAEELIEVIQDKEIKLPNEDPVLKACLSWLQYDPKNRLDEFDCIIQNVQLEYCTSEYLHHVITRHKELLRSPSIQSYLFEGAASKLTSAKFNIRPCARSCFRETLYIVGKKEDKKEVSVMQYDALLKTWIAHSTIPTLAQPDDFSISNTNHGFILSGEVVIHECSYDDGYQKMVINRLKFCDIYRFESKTLHNLSSSRLCHDSIVLGENLYLVGGRDDEERKATSFQVMNLKSEVWTSKSPLLYDMDYPILASWGVEVFAIPGFILNLPPDSAHRPQCFNTVTNKWSFKAALPETVETTCDASAVTFGDNIYLMGGNAKICCKYDVLMDSWAVLRGSRPMFKHMGGCAIAYQGSILFGGGWEFPSGKTVVVERYDVEKDEWKEWAKLPDGMHTYFMGVCYKS